MPVEYHSLVRSVRLEGLRHFTGLDIQNLSFHQGFRFRVYDYSDPK